MIHPEFNWDFEGTKQSSSSKAQRSMFAVVQDLFPFASDVFGNFPHPDLLYKGQIFVKENLKVQRLVLLWFLIYLFPLYLLVLNTKESNTME